MKAFLSLVYLVCSMGIFANAQVNVSGEGEEPAECSDIVQRVGPFQVHRYQGKSNCLFSALPMDHEPFYYHYRSYVFSGAGAFMVFNSYEDHDVTDGARVFTFFPRNQLPNLEVVDGRAVMKSATAGIEMILDSKKSIIYGMKGAKFSEDYEVNPNNAGGVELNEVQTLYLDSGFAKQRDPSSDFSRTSVFKDIKGQSCSLMNSELYDSLAHGNIKFKFTDAELKKFLAQRCPNLFVNW